jgi:hypothetical protein
LLQRNQKALKNPQNTANKETNPRKIKLSNHKKKITMINKKVPLGLESREVNLNSLQLMKRF